MKNNKQELHTNFNGKETRMRKITDENSYKTGQTTNIHNIVLLLNSSAAKHATDTTILFPPMKVLRTMEALFPLDSKTNIIMRDPPKTQEEPSHRIP